MTGTAWRIRFLYSLRRWRGGLCSGTRPQARPYLNDICRAEIGHWPKGRGAAVWPVRPDVRRRQKYLRALKVCNATCADIGHHAVRCMKGNLGLEAVALRRCEPLIRRWPDGPTARRPQAPFHSLDYVDCGGCRILGSGEISPICTWLNKTPRKLLHGHHRETAIHHP